MSGSRVVFMDSMLFPDTNKGKRKLSAGLAELDKFIDNVGKYKTLSSAVKLKNQMEED